ncbi:Rab3 GTPase-activating protein catalytic subunit [Camellia lanceoleosa]|uniref:Rab3 GTPase-activating protein catalytic subunit n=1 Tax=Camellia lanceoleosa TaxID=1840588 RepID=A0ACC0F4G2_9ERIC|nr:Rab3 GTPase-activating protein catalytic subunit [Camellia lanceoleosa]
MPSEDFVGKRDSGSMSDDSCHPETSVSRINSEAQDVVTSSDLRPSDCIRKGSASVVSMMLLKLDQNLHVPFTQDAPLMTEDMHEERLNAVEALGSSFNFSAQLERDILSSDSKQQIQLLYLKILSWHSPRDWENDDFEESGEVSTNDAMEALKTIGLLEATFERMSEHGNLWRKIWNDAPALPPAKPLLDPNREGEKVLHYLETLRPHLLLEQMVCTAFRASADTLNQATFGGLKQMVTKMGQLYLTMASTLKHLQANRLCVDSEITDDVKRLCVVFEHVEKLLTVAASLHRKFLQAPRLSEVIFSDYYDFYLPTMGTGAVAGNHDMKFDKKQHVRIHEREVVANMFTPPTANQSWRKVLSMGNLLNGHEPVAREIIFSVRDRVRGSYYAASTPRNYQKEIETNRMYICGTSNDLRVALSVASCD